MKIFQILSTVKNSFYNQIFFILIFALLSCDFSFALTLDEALIKAKENFPAYKAAKERVSSKENLFKASFSPYLPGVDLTHSEKYNDYVRGTNDDYRSRTTKVSVSQILYDFGRRKANRDISRLSFDIERENEKLILIELSRDVKNFFYQTLALKELLEQKKFQLELSQKDLDVAKGRYNAGVAKKSDFLQASVRFETARIELRQAQGDYKNSLYTLNSLIGIPDFTENTLEGNQIELKDMPLKEKFLDYALKRPEIIQAEKSLEIAKNNKKLTKSRYYPTLSLNMERDYSEIQGSSNDNTLENNSVYLFANWNLFDYSKKYELKSTDYEITASEHDIKEIKRQVSLSIYTGYEDLVTSFENLDFSKEQLKQAQFNYDQAFGEYKVGTGDILSLVQAETLLARAKENFIQSRQNISLNIVNLEYLSGMGDY